MVRRCTALHCVSRKWAPHLTAHPRCTTRESFYAFNRTGSGKGYSGVCTFVRKAVCMPLDAQEGLTGCLQLDRSRSEWRHRQQQQHLVQHGMLC